MGWLRDLLDPIPELTRLERNMEENKRREQNGVCSCSKNLCDCTYPSCIYYSGEDK